MPASRKGYGLPVLSMNEPIEVERIGSHFDERGIRRPDILIKGVERGRGGYSGVAFEYDGPDHMTPEGVRSDTLRGNELKLMGLREYRINADLYGDIDYMEGIVAQARLDAELPRLHLTEAQKRTRLRRHYELYEDLERIDGTNWSCFR